MNHLEQFVRDYFDLGSDNWLEKYALNVPDGATPDRFVDELKRLNFEFRFVDTCDWSCGQAPKGDLYLIGEGPRHYSVYLVERAIPILQGSYQTLDGAMRGKAEIIFVWLRLSAMPVTPFVRLTPTERFVSEYFELGENQWLKRYAHSVPKGMDADEFYEQLFRLGLQDKFVDDQDRSKGASPSDYLFLVEDEPGLYSVFTVERGMRIPQGTYSSLLEAMRKKAEIVFSMLGLAAMPIHPLTPD